MCTLYIDNKREHDSPLRTAVGEMSHFGHLQPQEINTRLTTVESTEHYYCVVRLLLKYNNIIFCLQTF